MKLNCRQIKNRIQNKWLLLSTCLSLVLPILFLLTVNPLTVHAESGSIQVILKNETGTQPTDHVGVMLFQIATENEEFDLIYTQAFKNTPFTEHELFHEDPVQNALTLQQYIEENGINGLLQTSDADGSTLFANLVNGAYLVTCKQNQPVSFQPFLVFIPTEIDTIEHFAIQSKPKTVDNPDYVPEAPPSGGDPSDDNDPSGGNTPPGENDPGQEQTPGTDTGTTMIPQTGDNMVMVYALLVAGVLMVLIGITDLTSRGDSRA